MDWTFWLAGVVILVALIVTQVFLHEDRWSRRRRPDDQEGTEPMIREEPDLRDGPSGSRPPQDGDLP